MLFIDRGAERRRHERLVSRYMNEIREASREVTRPNPDRRELLKAGLVAGSAGLLAMAGMPNFRPHWAHAQSADDEAGITLVSPPNTPFVDPLPILPVMGRTTLTSPVPTRGQNSGASHYAGFTEALRPDHQRWTEFGGLSNTAPGFTGAMYESVELEVPGSFYPAVDGVPPYPVWRFVDLATGAVGPLRIKAKYGEPVLHRVHNDLPSYNRGYGINQTTTHLHNGHTASESDGGPTHFYDAGHFKDYHYPNVRAGFASTHPTSRLNNRTVQGDVRETMSSLWFHDHRFDFTAQNVVKGLLNVYTLFSDDIGLDTDDETTGLRLPSGDNDIYMIFEDKVFDPSTGESFFDLFNLDGILGDKFVVNGKIQPYLEVKRRKYRFRFLDGGPSRFYEFFMSDGRPFVQISADGNLLPRPLTRTSVRIGVAERVDVIVDFSTARAGDRIYLQNRLEQTSGRGPTGNIIAPTDLVEFRVVGGPVNDRSRIPAKMLALPTMKAAAQTRNWQLGRSNGAWVINGNFFDPDVISAFPKLNTAEIWNLTSGGGWTHPLHIHFEEFQLLDRDGESVPADERARKDVFRIGSASVGTDNTSSAHLFMQFRDFLGDYPMHCHNIVHEDHAMMIRWQIVE